MTGDFQEGADERDLVLRLLEWHHLFLRLKGGDSDVRLTRQLRRALLVLSAGLGAWAGTLENSEKSFYLFESGHVRPLALSPGDDLLLALNTPDNRLQVFSLKGDRPTTVGQVLVGLEPVAVAVRGETAYVVNHLSDSISVIDLSDPGRPFVRETLLTGDEPRDVVVGGPGFDRLFVTTAHRGQNHPLDPELTSPGVGRADVWVWNMLDLAADPFILTFFGDTPRALAVSPDGTRVWAAVFLSGNQTTVLSEGAVLPPGGGPLDPGTLANTLINDGFVSPGLPPPHQTEQGEEAVLTGLILRWDGAAWRDESNRDWTVRTRFHLPDLDVFEIDASLSPPQLLRSYPGVGTVLLNMAVHPTDGSVYVSNLEARNQIRFEPELRGNFVRNRISRLTQDSVTSISLNPHIDYVLPEGSPAERDLSLAFPTDLIWSADGERLYVAAQSSRKIGVLNRQGEVIGRIRTGGGPSGLALDEKRHRLYCLNRLDHTISVIDLNQGRTLYSLPLGYNPEPRQVREGRPLLYSAANSGHGDTSCASCHIFGDLDGLAWDLGDPTGVSVENPLVIVEPQADDELKSFHPMKGPMTTQSLRGLMGAGAMHWRGDRNGGFEEPFSESKAFLAFRPTFTALMVRPEELPVEQMKKFRDFVLDIHYPPNPLAPLDGTLTSEQSRGKVIFDSDGTRQGPGGDDSPCSSCHSLPLGTDGQASFEGFTQDFKVAHLRNLYQKVGMFGFALPNTARTIAGFPLPTLEATPTPFLDDQVRGFGFLHDGSIPTLFNFFRALTQQFTFNDDAEGTGDEKVRALEAFLMAFSTGLEPVVAQQITVSGQNLDERLVRLQLLKARAEAGEGDFIASGVFQGDLRGMLYLGQDTFQTDRNAEPLTWSELVKAIEGDTALMTFTIVPPGSGFRIGIDQNSDGILNGDEPPRRAPAVKGWQRRR